jgi:hypothetical protein
VPRECPTRRRLEPRVLPAALSVLFVLVAATPPATASARVELTSSGRIGPLRIDRSGRTAVVDFAGQPDAEGYGSEGAGAPGWDALGYTCTERPPRHGFMAPLGGGPPYTYCRTVYYVADETGHLATFATNERRFRTRHGIRVGMRTRRAAQRAHRPATAGCTEAIYLTTRGAQLSIALLGARSVELHHRFLAVGGRVGALILSSKHTYLNVFDCL